ncbi:hypothetical protein CRG98_027524 [Punica granatum]|uniref:Hexosyltransferase n=1 Tax=Punica granatum TaxID=22663 RepID=A0A2I0J7A2_PUNGR|nr:hypothetical protein CRG98_027524 [Punica granatum]
MHSKGSSNRLSGMVTRSRISHLMLSMIAAFATIYVAGRLWQDSQSRVFLIKELDRITGQRQSAISADDALKIIACREQQNKLSALETELAAARQEGFLSKHSADTSGNQSKKKPLLVIGLFTAFGRKNNRDAIRKAWMGNGMHFSNQGDSLDRGIEAENRQSNDFIILVPHLDKPRVYVGCMKSGEVFSEQGHKWYEPDWWKFGDKKSYFRHASGEIYVISQALAKFISINRYILHTYAHDDVSAGSWFIGLDVKHMDDSKFCCSSWSSGSISLKA